MREWRHFRGRRQTVRQSDGQTSDNQTGSVACGVDSAYGGWHGGGRCQTFRRSDFRRQTDFVPGNVSLTYDGQQGWAS